MLVQRINSNVTASQRQKVGKLSEKLMGFNATRNPWGSKQGQMRKILTLQSYLSLWTGLCVQIFLKAPKRKQTNKKNLGVPAFNCGSFLCSLSPISYISMHVLLQERSLGIASYISLFKYFKMLEDQFIFIFHSLKIMNQSNRNTEFSKSIHSPILLWSQKGRHFLVHISCYWKFLSIHGL